MEVGNLGNIGLNQLNSHGSNIIKQINVLLNKVNQDLCMGDKLFLQELERPVEVLKFGNMNHPTPASVDLCHGIQERWKLMPKWSQEVSYQNLEVPLEVPKVGDTNPSTLYQWGSLPGGDAQG